ncbi:MAG: TolC family protein [Planctomycetota bacterium]|jgi:cobalt-zinc-cadmium efflux system outer membrane protein
MFTKLILFSTILAAVTVSGCAGHGNGAAGPVPGPLGQDLPVYQGPQVPATDFSDSPDIAEPNGILSLRQALALALMNNPGLRAFSWEVRAAQARQLQAGLAPNPEFKVEVEEAGGSGERRNFDGAETTIFLSQLIELGDKRIRRTELASLEKDLACWDYEAKRLDVFTEVAKAFVGVLAEQKRAELTEDLVRLSSEVLNTVRQRVQAGKDSPVEETKALVALANAEIESEKVRKDLSYARKRLSATWAGRSPVFAEAGGELDLILPVPSIDELRTLVYRNPDKARWAVEMDQRRAAVELAKANATQDVKLGGGLQHFNDTDDSAVVLGVSIAIPIFDRNQGNVLEARHNLAKAKAESRAVEAGIHAALAEAYARLSSAFTEATGLGNKVLEGAQSAFDAVREGYRTGKLGFLDVLDAQRTLFEARAQYINALASYQTAKADVERLIGRPIERINVSRNEDSK